MLDINRYLTDRITWERLIARDEYDGNTYAAPATIPARLHSITQVVRTNDGREITSNAHVTATNPINVGDRITDANGTKREIINVRIAKGVDGRTSHRVGDLA
jgi:hypothetical protein